MARPAVLLTGNVMVSSAGILNAFYNGVGLVLVDPPHVGNPLPTTAFALGHHARLDANAASIELLEDSSSRGEDPVVHVRRVDLFTVGQPDPAPLGCLVGPQGEARFKWTNARCERGHV